MAEPSKPDHSNDTPMLRQYREIKEQYKDAILSAVCRTTPLSPT
jgi:hypothetical protein